MLILNRNPVGINIKSIKTSIPSGSVEIVGCFSGNYSAALLQDVYKNSSKCVSGNVVKILGEIHE